MTSFDHDCRRLGPLTGRVANLRVGFVGASGATILGAGLAATTISPELVGSMRERLGWLDLLVLDHRCEGFDRQLIEHAVAGARMMGARVAGASRGLPTPIWSGLVDTDLAAQGGDPTDLAPVVDPRRVNPSGYRPAAKRRREAVPVPVSDGSPPAGDPASLIEALRPAVAAELTFSPGTDELEVARWLICLAAAGVPLICDVTPGVARLIGPELTAIIGSTTLERCRDPNERDLTSVRARRVALKQHSVSRRWEGIAERVGLRLAPRPTVSMILCTQRPQQLDHALEQVRRQTYTPCELVLVLHSDGFLADLEAQLEKALSIPWRVVRVPESRSLGWALNEGVAVASGDLIAKMDDDDWYGREHLWDLVLALDYSGADLVGKLVTEFVYLAALDITIRRHAGRSEIFGPAIASSTLMLRRQDLEAAGGFRDHWCDDMGLLRDIQGEGGRVYQTHGFGYVYRRQGGGHLFNTGDDIATFLPASRLQIRGLARAAADL